MRSGIDSVERPCGRRALGLILHCGPFVLDRSLCVSGDRLPQRDGGRFLPLGVAEKRSDRGRLLVDGILSGAEFLPHHDDGEGEQDGVDHADRCELEPCDFVVLDELLDPDPAMDERLRAHRDRGRDDDEEKNGNPERKA